VFSAPAPTPGWNAVLTSGQHLAISISLSATFIILVGFLGWVVSRRKHIAEPYLQSYNAGVFVLTIASLSYALLIYKFADSFQLLPGPQVLWGPTGSALFKLPFRYIDWAMTVPLLVVELVGASSLAGSRGYRLRSIGVVAAFLMIFSGWLGAQGIDNGYSLQARVLWGLISGVFFVIVYAIVIYTLRRSFPELQPGTGRFFRGAVYTLMASWFVYPVLYSLGGMTGNADLVVGTQIAYSVADIFAKVGFTLFIVAVLVRRSKAEAQPEVTTAVESKD
jgi:hypothetical protein